MDGEAYSMQNVGYRIGLNSCSIPYPVFQILLYSFHHIMELIRHKIIRLSFDSFIIVPVFLYGAITSCQQTAYYA